MSHYLEQMDPENPLGLLALTTGSLRAAIEAVPADMALMEERKLRERINPTPVDYSLRTSFWREYELAVRNRDSKIYAASIYAGICSDAYFYQKFLKDTDRVAWLLRPLQGYMKEIEAVLVRGTERLWELVEMDITTIDKNGDKKVDPRLASVMLEAIKMVENRAKGMAVQRSESKNLNVVAGPKQVLMGQPDEKTIDKRMGELYKKLHGEVIVVAEEKPEA